MINEAFGKVKKSMNKNKSVIKMEFKPFEKES